MSLLRQRLGRYELISRLSRGGMAELYLGVHEGPGGFRKFVCIKRILPDLREEEQFVEMFLDEARLSAGLSHANVCQVFELGQEGDELFIAMEYVAGLDASRMQKLLGKRGQRLPVGVAVAVVRNACFGLHAAHTFTSPSGRALPIVHRDFTPRNVMVSYAGAVKVVDFGIAKAAGGLGRTRAGSVKGSSAYMSPEQIRGEPLGPTTDVFSAGAVLFELLTGRRAFPGADDAQSMYQVLQVEPPDPRALSPQVPERLASITLQALSKESAARPQSALELARALEDAAKGLLPDELTIGAWMQQHFAPQLETTRTIFSMAETRATADELATAAVGLAEGPGTETPLPTLDGSERDADLPTASLPRFSGRERQATVLIVDDTLVGRTLVQAVLEEEHCHVVGAADGQKALALLERVTPDLIILDVRMPGMDGFELCDRIRSRAATHLTPILVLSGACSLDERVRGLSVGGDDFLRKPFEAPELVARVKLYLRKVASMATRT